MAKRTFKFWWDRAGDTWLLSDIIGLVSGMGWVQILTTVLFGAGAAIWGLIDNAPPSTLFVLILLAIAGSLSVLNLGLTLLSKWTACGTFLSDALPARAGVAQTWAPVAVISGVAFAALALQLATSRAVGDPVKSAPSVAAPAAPKAAFAIRCADSILPDEPHALVMLRPGSSVRVDLDEPRSPIGAVGEPAVACTITNLSEVSGEGLFLVGRAYSARAYSDDVKVPWLGRFGVTADSIEIGPKRALTFYVVSTFKEPMVLHFGGSVGLTAADGATRRAGLRNYIPAGIEVGPRL